MIEFKQIIGRGTRLYEGKDFFTVYDFVKAMKVLPVPVTRRTSGTIRRTSSTSSWWMNVIGAAPRTKAAGAAGFAGEVPAGLKKLPGDLEGDEGFARAGGQRQEDAFPSLCNGFQDALYGGLLIVAGLE